MKFLNIIQHKTKNNIKLILTQRNITENLLQKTLEKSKVLHILIKN